ncbi:hypothetical protein, conserved [Eimeria maxima]|uniref:Uncharacterized protein n=1 Tax=Eimeria maxima TaxID=5804 RepID=U6MFK4_EIMMA|nr:hypothetical protein, conserved [Eimeria maxima]CDJ61239.1 hypothetical protein, conserved [Eimeria maxima]
MIFREYASGPQMFLPYFSVAAGCLYALGLLGSDAVSPVPTDPPPLDHETESVSLALGDDQWSIGLPAEDGGRTQSIFSVGVLPDVSFVHDGALLSTPAEIQPDLPSGYLFEVEGTAQPEAASPAPSPKKSNGDYRVLQTSLITTLLVFAACLGGFKLRHQKFWPGARPEGSPEAPGQQQDGRKSINEQLVDQLHSMKKLEPLVEHLVEMMGTKDAVAASKDFQTTLQAVEQMEAKGSASSSDQLKETINSGISALSRLYEEARLHGLSLARQARQDRTRKSQVFSENELKILDCHLGLGFHEFFDAHEQNMEISFPALVRQVEQAAKDLKGLGGLNTVDDLHLLSAAVANVELIKSGHEAMHTEKMCLEEIRANAASVLFMSYQRKQEAEHRHLLDLFEQQRILYRMERERQLLLPRSDGKRDSALDKFEGMLRKGSQLLQQYSDAISRIAGSTDIIVAGNLERQAITIKEEVENLLKEAAATAESIPGVATSEELAKNTAMQRHLKSVALRTSEAAAEATERVASIMAALDVQMPAEAPFGWTQIGEENRKQVPLTSLNPSVAKLVKEAMRHVEVLRNSDIVLDEDQEAGGSAFSRTAELLQASQVAAQAAGALGDEAELLWLRAQLNDSLESDMQLSATLAWRAIAAVDGGEGERQFWRVELSPAEVLRFQDLVTQLNNCEQQARSLTGLKEAALAAAQMKDIACKLMSFVQDHQKLPTTH